MFHIEWSNVNQAWFLMFGDSVLRIFNDKQDAEDLLDEWRGP